MDQATIRAENEFQLGLVPDAVQVRLLRMSVPSVAEMTEFAKVKDSKKEAKESGEGDQVLKNHLFDELLSTEKKYVEDMDLIIKVCLVCFLLRFKSTISPRSPAAISYPDDELSQSQPGGPACHLQQY